MAGDDLDTDCCAQSLPMLQRDDAVSARALAIMM
jgi:hypothetical protein